MTTGVYDMINAGLSKGVFLLQPPAQLKMGQRLRSRNLLDLAYQVALIRPGVGVQGSAVSQFVERYRHGAEWEYDHPLEERALERGCGIIVWQEQVVQLIQDVAGMTAAEADEVRRAFSKPNSEHLVNMHRRRFLEGAAEKGVPEETAQRIFGKINGHYMFPESHSHAFAITAYQAAWLKRYHPLEFLRRADEQPADGLLSCGDAQAGRGTLRSELPEPGREREPGRVRSGVRLGEAGSSVRQGRWSGVCEAHRGGEGGVTASMPRPGTW